MSRKYRMACGRCGQLLLKRDGYCPICHRMAVHDLPGWPTRLVAAATLVASAWLLIVLAGALRWG